MAVQTAAADSIHLHYTVTFILQRPYFSDTP